MIVSRAVRRLTGATLAFISLTVLIAFILTPLLPSPPLLTYYAYLGSGGAIFMVDRGLILPLFKTPASFVSMVWSPNAEKIAYITYENDAYYLNTVDSDGRNARRVTDQSASAWRPVWSPDSALIAFEAQLAPNTTIFLVKPNGDDLRNLVGSELVWSADGTQVALVSEPPSIEISLMNATCLDDISLCNPKRITTNDRLPSWSPDGSQLAFLSNRDGKWEVYTVDSNCDPCEARQLTDLSVSAATSLNWSPDGRWITFVVSPLDSGSLIYVVDTTCMASNCVKLISNREIASHGPEWSPDGGQIAYYRSEGSGTRIMLLDTDCILTASNCVGREQAISPANTMAYYPIWRPIPN